MTELKPSFAKNDINMFYKYLNKASNYLEFGSGGSTYQASICSNIKLIISVESDKSWYNTLNSIVKHSNFHSKLVDLKCKPNTWGFPTNICPIDNKIKYSSIITHYINRSTANSLDLILIDGRFRVACALKAHSVINKNCKIIFDDFLNRSYYHIVLQYFDIVEKTIDNRMVILVKKSNTVPIELIKKYELIPN